MAIQIDFQWRRDAAGYDIVDGYGDTAFDVDQHGQLSNPRPVRERRIVPRSRKFVPCPPLSPDLCMAFAGLARDEAKLLQFVEQHGPLTQMGNSNLGESVSEDLKTAAQMRELLFQAQGNRPSVELNSFNVELAIGHDRSLGTTIKYRVDELQDALWIQCAAANTSGTTFRDCAYCGALFKAGLGTGRRQDAKYCSDAHRLAHHSKMRGMKLKTAKSAKPGKSTEPGESAKPGSRKLGKTATDDAAQR
jgi:hypothetical protein